MHAWEFEAEGHPHVDASMEYRRLNFEDNKGENKTYFILKSFIWIGEISFERLMQTENSTEMITLKILNNKHEM